MSRRTEVLENMTAISRCIEQKEKDVAFLENADIKHLDSITLEFIDKSKNEMLGRITCPASKTNDMMLVVEMLTEAYRKEINLTYELLGRMVKEL